MEEKSRTIKHLVVCGGGETGFSYYGALSESNKNGFWKLEDIVSIYATSVGSIFSLVIVCLKQIDWVTLDTFMYERPWDQVFTFNMDQFMHLYTNVGMLGRKTIYDTFYPIFTAMDISMDVTMEEMFQFSGVDLHFFTTKMESFELVDVSYKTHPHWKVVDAVYASCALPILFRPAEIDGSVYIDGAVLCNFPLKQCIEIADHEDEILAFEKCYPPEQKPSNKVTHYENIIQYITNLVENTLEKLTQTIEIPQVKNCVKFYGGMCTAYTVYKTISDPKLRNGLIDEGKQVWREFEEKRRKEIKSERD